MATVFSSFGGKVTIICSSTRLLPRFEPEAGKRVKAALEAEGAQVLTSVSATAFTKLPNGNFEATISDGRKISGTTVLIAAGRKVRTEGIGLEKVGVNPLKLQWMKVSASKYQASGCTHSETAMGGVR